MDGGRTNKGRRPPTERSEQTTKISNAQPSPAPTTSNASPAMTIDNDSNASTRTHIFGVPGVRIPSVLQQQRQIQQQPPTHNSRPRAFSADSPFPTTVERPRGLAAMHAAHAQIGASRAADSHGKARQRRISSSPLGITRDNTLHQQLLLVGAPDSANATKIVTRLPIEEDRMAGAGTATAMDNDGTRDPPVAKEEKKLSTASAHKADAPRPKAAATRSRSQRRTTPMPIAGSSTAQVSQPPQPNVFTFKAQAPTQEQQKQQQNGKADISSRPIALPKTRLSNLRPTLRQMPKSKEVAQVDAQFSSNGRLVARRPDYFVFEDEPLGEGDDHEIDLSLSYIDDIGFDLADAELNSDFGKSFDLDMLPDPPPRRLSDYNIGVKDVPIRSPPSNATETANDNEPAKGEGTSQKRGIAGRENDTNPPSTTKAQQQQVSATSKGMSATSLQSSAYESATELPLTPQPNGLAALITPVSERHRTLGLPSNNMTFAKPVITEENAHFYIKMFALRSTVPSEELSPQESPPQRNENRPESITTIDHDSPMEPAQPQREQQQASGLRPSPHRSNFWPENALMFQNAVQPQHRQPEIIAHPCIEVQAECPRVFHSPASFASKARDFFRGRPKSKSAAGHIRNASDGRHIAQQPPTKAPITTTTISTAAEQQQQQQQHLRRQTMPSLGATSPHTDNPSNSRKRAATTGYASGLEARLPTGSATTAGADSNAETVRRRHTVHISTRSGAVRRRHTVARAVQSGDHRPADRILLSAQNPMQTDVAVDTEQNSGRSSGVGSKQFPLLGEEHAVAANNAEKLPDTRLSSSLGDDICGCCRAPTSNCGCCFGNCFTGCWPFRVLCSGKHKDSPRNSAATIDPALPEEPMPANPPASPSNSVFSALSESWGHIYRSRNAGRPVTRKRDKVRDTCAYPFRWGYNCILLCSSPCIGLAREYRSACTCC